jgi:hypothetical protein
MVRRRRFLVIKILHMLVMRSLYQIVKTKVDGEKGLFAGEEDDASEDEKCVY